MCQKMIFDIDSGESKYREAILLLTECVHWLSLR